jgi:hypothetical protein
MLYHLVGRAIFFPNYVCRSVTKNYGWEILGFGQHHPHHGAENRVLFYRLVIHRKVYEKKLWGGDKLVVNSTRKFREWYNVFCFILEWRRILQVVEHGSGATIRRHKFLEAKHLVLSCVWCVCIWCLKIVLCWREGCPTIKDGGWLSRR